MNERGYRSVCHYLRWVRFGVAES